MDSAFVSEFNPIKRAIDNLMRGSINLLSEDEKQILLFMKEKKVLINHFYELNIEINTILEIIENFIELNIFKSKLVDLDTFEVVPGKYLQILIESVEKKE